MTRERVATIELKNRERTKPSKWVQALVDECYSLYRAIDWQSRSHQAVVNEMAERCDRLERELAEAQQRIVTLHEQLRRAPVQGAYRTQIINRLNELVDELKG